MTNGYKYSYIIQDKSLGLRYRSSAYYNAAFFLWPCQKHYLKAYIISPNKTCRNKVSIVEKQYTIVDAKNKLPSLIHYVETGQTVKLTRYGKPVAVLLSIKDYKRLSRKREGYWRALTSLRNQLASEHIFSDSGDFENLRDPSSGREIEFGR